MQIAKQNLGWLAVLATMTGMLQSCGASGQPGAADPSMAQHDTALPGKLKRCTAGADCNDSPKPDGAEGKSKVFETVWEIFEENPELTLPYYDDDSGTAKCDFTILWGDERAGVGFDSGTRVTDCSKKRNITHTYAKEGTYHVKIRGIYNGWGVGRDSEYYRCVSNVNERLKEVVSFGSVGLTAGAFCGSKGVIFPKNEIPDATLWRNAGAAFALSDDISGAIVTWDTSNVTDMSDMFCGAEAFNHPIGQWNTASVIKMPRMFYGAKAFNQPIGQWNTASVTDMSMMFEGAEAFNQPIGQWNTASVTDMSRMFYEAEAFNQPIGQWNTARVTDMSEMFWGANAFNQPIGQWNTARITNMSGMFYEADAFNQPIGQWNTVRVTDMSGMFAFAEAFNQPIGQWNTASVTNMSRMFKGAKAFNQPIGQWNTASVTNMSEMFFGTKAFNQPIGQWNTVRVTDMSRMFQKAKAFNQDLSRWKLNASVSVDDMFQSSALSKANYCAISRASGWKDKKDIVGVDFVCR